MEKSCLTCEFGKTKTYQGNYYCYKRPKNSRLSTINPAKICNIYEPKEEPKKMDKQTAIINHRHMWNWLSENPKASKRDYLRAHNIESYPKTDCFLCEYMNEQEEWDCRKCILMWPHHDSACDEGSELYIRWRETTNPISRAELARQIRDLPERGEERIVDIAARSFEVDASILSRSIEAAMRGTSEENKPFPPPKLTRTEAIAKTREQWKWLAHHPETDKGDYFKAKDISEKPIYGCYLCKWVRNNTDINIPSSECDEVCLLSWPGGWCEAEDGLHSLWCEAMNRKDYKLTTAIAYLIYRLPEKE